MLTVVTVKTVKSLFYPYPPARAYSVIEKQRTYQGVRNRKYKITVFTVITVTHSRAVGSRKHFVRRPPRAPAGPSHSPP